MSNPISIDILAFKNSGKRNWYLCKGNLLEYLINLKDNFYDFAIQRRIVKNQYLDSLYQTVKSGDPIPVLTLTYAGPELDEQSGATTLDMTKIEILDGLQRTFRLWSYKILADNYRGQKDGDIVNFAKELKQINSLLFESGVINTSLIRRMIGNNEITQINSAFKQFDIYFIVWAGLKEREVVRKMLVLNAGQKAVSKTHQFELLFLHFFDKIRNGMPEIELFRERDAQATDIRNGRRATGQFMFSSFIVGLQSFVEQKPVRVNTEEPIGIDMDDVEDSESYDLLFTQEYLKVFIRLLVNLDKIIAEKEGGPGLEWFVKETTLSGVLAAVGTTIDFTEIQSVGDLIEVSEKAFGLLTDIVRHKGFQIETYRREFANISSRAINFGTFIRKAIMEYTVELIAGRDPDWRELFIKTQEAR